MALSAASVGLPAILLEHGVPANAARIELAAAAGAPCPIDYRWVVAVAQMESGHGTSGGSSVDESGRLTRPIHSGAGAQGFTQFIPETAAAYGLTDPLDAAAYARATAAKLCNDGIMTDPDNALGAYNGGAGWRKYAESRNYVALAHVIVDALPPPDGSPPVALNVAAQSPAPPAEVAVQPPRSWTQIWSRLSTGIERVGGNVLSDWVWLGGHSSGGWWDSADRFIFGR